MEILPIGYLIFLVDVCLCFFAFGANNRTSFHYNIWSYWVFGKTFNRGNLCSRNYLLCDLRNWYVLANAKQETNEIYCFWQTVAAIFYWVIWAMIGHNTKPIVLAMHTLYFPQY